MPAQISQNVVLPPYPNILLEWGKRSHMAAERLVKILDFVRWFCNRGAYDCRVVREDPETFVRSPVDGEYYDSPCRRILWIGTAEERQKGFFYDDSTTEDAGEFTNIRTYSKSIPVDVIYTESSVTLEGHYITGHPNELAYQAMVHGMCLGACSRIFILKGAQGPEQGMYCFPIQWGDQKDLYLVVTIDSRYGDRSHFLFQGDVEAFAATRKRGPRHDEVEAYFKDRAAWPLREAPVDVPMTYSKGEWTEPRPVQLRDLSQAQSALLALGYLYAGGA